MKVTRSRGSEYRVFFFFFYFFAYPVFSGYKTIQPFRSTVTGKIMKITLYHCSTNIVSTPRIKGNCGYGFYLSKKREKLFGNVCHKVKCELKTPLTFRDNEVSGKGFFNMSADVYEQYISLGVDSLMWYRGGKLMEVVILSSSCVKSIEIIY